MAVTAPAQQETKVPEYPSSIPPSLLLLILDLHPLSWSLLEQPPPKTEDGSKIANSPLDLNGFLNVLMIFLNSVLASSGSNQVVVYGATSGRSYVLICPQKDWTDSDQGRCYTHRPRRMKLVHRPSYQIVTNRLGCLIRGLKRA
jgi:hypothetical protein